MTQNILMQMVEHNRKVVEQRKKEVPLGGVRALASMQSRPIDLSSTLREDQRISLIAQIKRTAPDMQKPLEHYDPVILAKRFETSGARALMIATDQKYYQGTIPDLVLVAQNRSLPVIRQDIIEEEYQIVEARAAGADGVLLIASLLEPDRLRDLISISQRNRMTAVVQVQSENEVRSSIPFEPRVVAISNRDMRDFSVSLDRTLRLRELLPPHTVVISIGGLRTAEDIAYVYQAGINGIVVGQALLTAPDTARAIKELFKLTSF